MLGGSVQDNLFQISNLEEHLDLLVSVGGNYVRSTMSSRDPGNAKPFVRRNGLYDLEAPNPEYWNRIESLLNLAKERDIIVQVEICATYDFYWGGNSWAENPCNPQLSSSYNEQESGLPVVIDYPAQSANNLFFKTVPELDNNPVVLEYQKNFVDKPLSISLEYPNVLYCIDNETKARPVNNVKIYGGMMFPGADGMYWTALHKDGEERFWRNIFAGHASARFHRPDYGLGLNHVAQHHIKSMRMLAVAMDFFMHEPATHLL